MHSRDRGSADRGFHGVEPVARASHVVVEVGSRVVVEEAHSLLLAEEILVVLQSKYHHCNRPLWSTIAFSQLEVVADWS